MANIAIQRIKRELKEVMSSDETSRGAIKVEPVSDSLTTLKGEIIGPPDTPYHGARFDLEIQIPETYPFNPPKVRFVTKVWHPNVSSVTGAICLDILKNQWAAAMTLRTVLLSIQALLSSGEAEDPQDAVVAKQCKESPEIFYKTAQHWANVYAKGPNPVKEYDKLVTRVMDLGVSANDARTALSSSNWSLEKATEILFS